MSVVCSVQQIRDGEKEAATDEIGIDCALGLSIAAKEKPVPRMAEQNRA